MSLFASGILIKGLRKFKGMTQEELCEGICTPGNLARIERGKTHPSLFVYKALMEKLGEDPYKYYSDIITANDKFALDLNDTLTNLLRNLTEESNIEAEKLILQHENNDIFINNKYYKQYLKMHRATLAHNRKEYEDAYNYAFEAIKLLNPEFNEENIDMFYYTTIEIDLINTMASAQFNLNSTEQSIKTYLKLKASLDKNYIDNEHKRKYYIKVLYNISCIYGILNQYNECDSICDKGISLCKTEYNLRFLPLLIFNKGCCMLYSEEKEKGKELMVKALALFYGSDNHSEVSMIQSFLNDEWGIPTVELNEIYKSNNITPILL